MISFKFKNVCIESIGVNIAPIEVTSAAIEDRLAPLYQKLGIPFGTLERLSGISTRYLFPPEVMPSEIATGACKDAIAGMGIDPQHIGAVFSCSVVRDYFEPATACIVHRNLELPETTMAMDISNACIGFSNGMMMMAQMIEAGIIKAGIVTSGEALHKILEYNFKFIMGHEATLTRDELIKVLPTYTLGSGGVAFVLAHESIATQKHKLLGGAARSATQFNDLCKGDGDYFYQMAKDFMPVMYTESSRLISAAAELGARTWADASRMLGWTSEQVDHIFCHQVGRQVNDSFYSAMGLDMAKEYTIYKKYGNLISASLPMAIALGTKEKNVKAGEKILLTAFGSGLNSLFMGIEW
jgi:3-oxoacyl-[acyl-carrier-protein] synthase III